MHFSKFPCHQFLFFVAFTDFSSFKGMFCNFVQFCKSNMKCCAVYEALLYLYNNSECISLFCISGLCCFCIFTKEHALGNEPILNIRPVFKCVFFSPSTHQPFFSDFTDLISRLTYLSPEIPLFHVNADLFAEHLPLAEGISSAPTNASPPERFFWLEI